jgi:hypothetical protein
VNICSGFSFTNGWQGQLAAQVMQLELGLKRKVYTDKKENEIFLTCKEIRRRSVAKSYMRKGFLIYEKMRQLLTIYEEAVGYIRLWKLEPILSIFPYCEENLNLFFIIVVARQKNQIF